MATVVRRFGIPMLVIAVWVALLGVHGGLEYVSSEWWPTQDEVPWGVEWARASFENLQSEMFQIAVACLLVDLPSMKRRWFTAAED